MTSKWPMRQLGDIFDIARGGSPRPIQDYLTDDPDGINWIMISDATDSDKYIYRTTRRIKVEGAKSSRRVAAGDFLLTNSMSFGRPYIMKTDGCIHDGWLHLKKRSQEVDDDYFYYLLGSDAVYSKFKRLAAGATVKNLNIDLVSGLFVPFPDLQEQRRIARILDKTASLRSKREEAIGLADALLRTVFVEMFGSLDKKADPLLALGDLVEIDAPMVDPTLDEFADLPHVGPDRIEKMTGLLYECQTAREEGVFSKKFLFDDSYVLYSKIRPQLRKCALPDFRGLCSADMYPVRPKDRRLTKQFLWGLLLSDRFHRYVTTLPDRANIPKLNRSELNSFEFNLPDLRLQAKYSEIVQATLVAKSRQLQFLKTSTAMPASFGFFS